MVSEKLGEGDGFAAGKLGEEYEFIRACSLSVKLAAADTTLPEATRRERAGEVARKAIHRLGRLPYGKVPELLRHLAEEPDFEPLRARPDFQAIQKRAGSAEDK